MVIAALLVPSVASAQSRTQQLPGLESNKKIAILAAILGGMIVAVIVLKVKAKKKKKPQPVAAPPVQTLVEVAK